VRSFSMLRQTPTLAQLLALKLAVTQKMLFLLMESPI
jgi:hypothetical protein